ncbi:CPBP family intramembrane glutamic endopeptidase [Oceanirhabdus sp. W0125-5]|uniref:CPBP family intramembrane glutamic endopeptidase n=1 Tax=Oceanirhabdus sp. W0125-5 TaxID=2999116 RepID=UPI0022F31328|nr:CPBP family intramembrane glutamic endopeptidase [Oceanirhabdus sp. W0125-5]WBW97443.1 CPBP family intramembrane metalloprotease [Oceanirhabdus sp. W0125-5]
MKEVQSRLIEGFRSEKKKHNPFISALILIAIVILAYVLMQAGAFIGVLVIAGIKSVIPTYVGMTGNMLLQLVFVFGGMTVVFMLFVKLAQKRKVRTLGFYKENAGKNYIKGFFIGIAMMAISVLICYVTGAMKPTTTSTDVAIGAAAIGPVFLILIGWIIQGGTEEIITRGWLLPVIGARYNVILGVIISSSFFGLLHLGNNNVGVLPMINLILFGVFAAVYALKEGSIWGVMGIHSAWNWAQGNIFGIEVSGNPVVGGTLLKFNHTGSQFISGGGFGIEGGIACTVVLVVGIVLAYKFMNREKIQSIQL